MKFVITTALAMIATHTLAADYPRELIGSYVGAENNDTDACKNPLVVINKSARYDIADAECKPIKVKPQGKMHIVMERCGREDSSWNQTAYFDMGPVLTLTEQSKYQGKNIIKLRSCNNGVGLAAPISFTSCTANPDYAGIASYYDDKLTKVATEPIRDFDGYTFRSEKTLTVNKTKVLFGKLVRADGTVGRGSYINEDEWICK